jgi:hypothetical protein
MNVGAGLRWLVGAAVGMLVFMIGVSVLFESILLGLLLTASSFLMIPETRTRLRAASDVNVPFALLVVLLAVSLVAPSLVFEETETGTYFGTDEAVTVEVSYDGEWQGELETRTSYRSMRGPGNATYLAGENSGTIEATASKTAGDGGTLRLSILVGDDVVATTTAGPGETEVSVEHRIDFL